jgi:hydrogenase expression/formation protein HypE
LACEGRLLAVCRADEAARVLACMRAHPQGRSAAVIGEVLTESPGFVQLETPYGGNKLLDWPAGEQLPRIC